MARIRKTPSAQATTDAPDDLPVEAKVAAPSFRKKDLVEAVATASGIKKKTVKPVVDAVLAQLGVALARGDTLVMPPLGRVAVNRSKEGATADIIILKLRRAKPGTAPEAPEAEPASDD